MRRVIFYAVIALAVFSCTYGDSATSATPDSTNKKVDGTNNSNSDDTIIVDEAAGSGN